MNGHSLEDLLAAVETVLNELEDIAEFGEGEIVDEARLMRNSLVQFVNQHFIQ